MTPQAASVLALLAVAAAIECPDETWLQLNGKCYSKQASGTHAECATICGANASLCLANRFRDHNAARKLAWVLITDPVTSATMYNALGAVVLSAALVFLPGLLDAFV